MRVTCLFSCMVKVCVCVCEGGRRLKRWHQSCHFQVHCKIPHRRVRDVLLALLVVLMLTCCMRFGASGSEVSSRHQEQNREGGKAQSGQYTACWAGLLHLVSELTSPAVQWCRRGRRAP
jgi:hypothetical protein